MIEIIVTPVPKPRQTRADVWKKRPCVMRYRAFADEVRFECKKKGIVLTDKLDCVFVIPMSKSWSKKKKELMNGKPHKQRPDIDNLCKALMDSLLKEDSVVYSLKAIKLWGCEGKIIFN